MQTGGRRSFLKLGLTGLTLPQLLDIRAQGKPASPTTAGQGFGSAKSCIVLFAWGGLSHLDTFDMKPDTLVVLLTEFGRTPKINGGAGRDHFPDCYSVAYAGAGIQGGQLYGASDNLGAKPAEKAAVWPKFRRNRMTRSLDSEACNLDKILNVSSVLPSSITIASKLPPQVDSVSVSSRQSASIFGASSRTGMITDSSGRIC